MEVYNVIYKLLFAKTQTWTRPVLSIKLLIHKKYIGQSNIEQQKDAISKIQNMGNSVGQVTCFLKKINCKKKRREGEKSINLKEA